MTKITELPQTTTLAPTDLLAVVTNVGTTPTTKKIAIADFGVSNTEVVIVGDGVTDLGPRLRAALVVGGTIRLVGTVRYVATATPPVVAAGTLLVGATPTTTINIETDAGSTVYREFLPITSDDITLRSLVITRASDFPMVMFPCGVSKRFSLEYCRIVGNVNIYPVQYCHAIQLGRHAGVAERLMMRECDVSFCTFGLFQSNASTATTKGILISSCRFHDNDASDLEFNNPFGLMSDVRVQNCTFMNNRMTVAGAGFGCGFAFVRNATVSGCTFENYYNEAIHIEDYSSDITIEANTFKSVGLNRASFIQVISGSTRIRIASNTLDAAANTTFIYLINVQAAGTGLTVGGRASLPPTSVTISNNHLLCGSMGGMYLEVALTTKVTGNTVEGTGTYTAGSYGGNVHYGIHVYSGQNNSVIGNTVKGFLFGIRGEAGVVGSYGAGTVVSNNNVSACWYGIHALNLEGGNTISGNTTRTCIYPLIVGQGGTVNRPSIITGNSAYGCAAPMQLSFAFLQSTSTITVGTTKTFTQWNFNNIDLPIPTGTVIRFSGGGTFTTTAASGTTTITGTVTDATIAANDTATVMLPWSTTPADNHKLLATNQDDYWETAGIRSPLNIEPTNIVPLASLISSFGPTAWPLANLAMGNRFYLPGPATVRYVNAEIDVSSGNIQFSVVQLSQNVTYYLTGVTVMTTGVIVCPGAGNVHLDMGSTRLEGGEYALLMWANNATVQVPHAQSSILTARTSLAAIGLTGGIPTKTTILEPTNRFIANMCLTSEN